jgi:hypothetical protein
MKKLLTLIVLAGGLNFCQAQQSFNTEATSTQEVPPNNLTTIDGTYAAGGFTLTGTTLTVASGFYGYSYAPTVISIGAAAAGDPLGATLFNLNIDPDQFPVGGGLVDGTFSGSGTLTPPEVTELENGDLYVNIQTSVSQASSQPGEVRGQLSQVPEPATMTLMGLGSMAWMAMRRKKI